MSHSPHSSAGNGPPSSPFGGTDLTQYSPVTARQNRRHASPVIDKKPVTQLKAEAPPGFQLGHVTYKDAGLQPQPHPLGTFISELDTKDPNYMSRFLLIMKLSDGTQAGADHEMELFHIQHLMKLYQVFSSSVPVYCRGVHLRFDNLRDSCEAKLLLETHSFEVRFIDNYGFALAKSQDTAAIDEFEGQIKIVVQIEPTILDVTKNQPVFTVHKLCWLNNAVEVTMSRFGTLCTLVHTATTEDKMRFTYRVEFHSAEAANRTVASLSKDPWFGMGDDNLWRWSIVEIANWIGPRAPNSPHRRLPRIDDKGRLVEFRHLPQLNPNANTKHPADAHNRVRRERILDGTDVRTTIMLRNIPNKLDWMTLKALLDQVCFGTYDFLYLRIDFKSGSNVGYAFINFADVSGMIAMLDKIEHRGWFGYRSNKNAEISYATIQGKEALVQKFRNSSVMQETPFCRPRLFLAYDDAYNLDRIRFTGIEQPFPSPDNLSKLQRSMDSARSIGLFPPSGITNNGGARNCISGYDRGTPRDMLHTTNQMCQYGFEEPAAGISDSKRRECEQWYAMTYGSSQAGLVPFEHIPWGLVQEFLRLFPKQTRINATSPPGPGVIGRPVAEGRMISTYMNSFANPDMAFQRTSDTSVLTTSQGPLYFAPPPKDWRSKHL